MHLPTSLNEFLKEQYDSNVFYHGSTDKKLAGKKGIHVGTKLAATQALQARIGVPAKGEWDGTREYGKTLLAGRETLKIKNKELGYYCDTGFNCGRDLPDEDYYPTDRTYRAKYSDGSDVPLDCKPIVFPVKIIGKMTNSPNTPLSDAKANSLMIRHLKLGNARSGYYYENIGEDEGSISAVVPDKSFLQILDNINESSFFDYSKDKILTDKFISNFMNEDTVSNILSYYITDNKLEDIDEDEVRNSKEFKDYIKNLLEIEFDRAKEDIYDHISNDDKITIYREMMVSDTWLDHLIKQGNHLGVYWSYDKTAAEPHWGYGKGKNKVSIESEIDEKYIDWEETLRLNTHFDYYMEKEIRLFKNTPLKIKSLFFNDEEVDISPIKNKTFLA